MDWLTYTDVAAWTLVLIIAVYDGLIEVRATAELQSSRVLLMSLLTLSSPSGLFHSLLSSMVAYRTMS